MNKSHVYLPILLAGLLAAAGARAQSPASASSDLPAKAGEASTQTMGVPNAKTTNSPASEAPIPNKDARIEGQTMGAGAAPTADVPVRAGEASTTVQGKPNADPNMPAANKDAKKEAQSIMGAGPATASAAGKTRAEVIAELMGRRAAFDAARRATRDSTPMMPRS
jgi:hypothetical protein